MFLFCMVQFLASRAWAQNISIGIVGAGISGLYAALLLQSLEVEGISYEILEASNRTGGRILTHHFGPDPYDYFVRSRFLQSFKLTIIGCWSDANSKNCVYGKSCWEQPVLLDKLHQQPH